MNPKVEKEKKLLQLLFGKFSHELINSHKHPEGYTTIVVFEGSVKHYYIFTEHIWMYSDSMPADIETQSLYIVTISFNTLTDLLCGHVELDAAFTSGLIKTKIVN